MVGPPEYLRNKYKWWPLDDDGTLGLGFVFRSGEWKKIKDYKQPKFAPGFSWKDEIVPENIITHE